jgi:hypothetical protein
MTWSIASGRPPKNRSSAAGFVASKAALFSASSSAAGPLEAVGVAGGQNDLGAFGAGPAGRLEPDACAAADHDDGLPGQFRPALRGGDVVAAWSGTGTALAHDGLAATGWRAAATLPRSALSAST